ncbi:MAG TPA: MFS transporter [Verrucomicrobiae bacterium]
MSTAAQHKTRTLGFVSLLHGFTHLYHVALMPLYLLMQRDFGFASVGRATSLVTVLMLAYFVPSFALGVLADRWNRRKLLGWGLAINGLGFVGLALSPNYACAVASVILAGIGGSFYHPAATAMLARLFPVNTGRALGIAGIGASVGFFCGPLFTGWRAGALEAARGAAAWRVPVLELGVAGIVAAALFAWFSQDAEPTAPEPSQTRPPVPMFPTGALWLWFLAAALLFSLRDFAAGSMCSLSSLFLQNAQGYNTGRAGFALSWIFLAGVISNPLFGHLSDRGRKRWITAVLLAAAMIAVAFPHLPAGWAVPAFFAYGFFFNANFPMIEAELMQSVPDAVRGRVVGLFMTIGGFFGNLSHWVVGDAVRRMGDGAQRPASYAFLYFALAALMLLALSGLPCLHALRRREHLDASVLTAFPVPQNKFP